MILKPILAQYLANGLIVSRCRRFAKIDQLKDPVQAGTCPRAAGKREEILPPFHGSPWDLTIMVGQRAVVSRGQ